MGYGLGNNNISHSNIWHVWHKGWKRKRDAQLAKYPCLVIKASFSMRISYTSQNPVPPSGYSYQHMGSSFPYPNPLTKHWIGLPSISLSHLSFP